MPIQWVLAPVGALRTSETGSLADIPLSSLRNDNAMYEKRRALLFHIMAVIEPRPTQKTPDLIRNRALGFPKREVRAAIYENDLSGNVDLPHRGGPPVKLELRRLWSPWWAA